MSNANNDNIVGSIGWLIKIILSILSGFLAWNLIEPSTFFGGILFLAMWGTISAIVHVVAFSIFAFMSQ